MFSLPGSLLSESGMKRRTFLTLSIAAAAGQLSSPRARADQPLLAHGCCVSNNEFSELLQATSGVQAFSSGSETIIHHSDDRTFDQALAIMLASISSVFDVLPGFGYYDDGNSHNAYASPQVRTGRTDGTVLFGLGLLRDKLREQAGGSRVAAVCAHEFGHIVQFKHNLQGRIRNGQRTVKPIELHADFLAGYYAARHREDNPSFPAAEFAMSQYKGGDPYVGQEDHHGTREERGAAVEAGYKARKNDGLTLSEAIEKGIQYVS